MKPKIIAMFSSFLIILLVISFPLFVFPKNLFANPGVTIRGTVWYWNLEEGGLVPDDANNYTSIAGGSYKRLKDTYIEVEFSEWTISDVETKTDSSGEFNVDVRNPAWGRWHVDIEVNAWTQLDYNSGDPITVDGFEDSTDIFKYNGQTGERSVGKNGTLMYDVYIGGPSNNIDSWWDADITSLWDDGAGQGENHTTAIFMTQVIKDAFNWAVSKAPTVGDLDRTTCILFPSDETGVFGYFANVQDQYKPYQLPPGTGHIHIMPKRMLPSQFTGDDFFMEIGDRWRSLRYSVTHEYGHKIMHDIYWAWPCSLEVWNGFDSSHNIYTCRDPETGWVEGWAEFFAAAVVNKATINGEEGSGSKNIEITYSPDAGMGGIIGEGREASSITWVREMSSSGYDGIRHKNEGEVAAVLWDIYDSKGWEYMSAPQQNASKPNGWPTDLHWYERLSDPNLDIIWGIMKNHNPDCLIDEGDFWLDSFFYYWKQDYQNNKEYMHGLKAIMYNRGIPINQYPENAPQIALGNIDDTNNIVNFAVTENNQEDQPFLYYNIAYQLNPGEEYLLIFNEDRPLSNLNTSWSNNTLNVSADLPALDEWNDVIVLVHDSMMANSIILGPKTEFDIIRYFFSLIDQGRTQEAADMLDTALAADSNSKQQWKSAFDGFESVEVLSKEPFNEQSWTENYEIYKVVINVQIKPEKLQELINWDGQSIRWISIVKSGDTWKIGSIATSP